MATPTVDSFLGGISQLLRQKNADELRNYLVIEPPYADSYNTIVREVRQVYAKGREEGLDEKCVRLLPEASEGIDGGPTWTAFVKFMVQYFCFLRDVDVGNLLETYNLLSELQQKCNSALAHPSAGVLILPTVVAYSRVLARLAIGLDKQPQLIAHLVVKSSDEGGSRETLPERAANILRQAFVTCLNDRAGVSASGLSQDGRPEGRKRGIYTLANTCLKILFACRKTRGAAQIFDNIYNQSPPLAAYPKAERVTYLYYLGRFLWSNGHFYRAQKALQKAYDECHPQARQQRRLILIFLIASNLVCGRFPSQQLYARPEAQGLRGRFEPLCRAITRGDLVGFRSHLDEGAEYYSWFSYYRIDLQLRNRCEVYVWRSLARKTFLLTGDPGDPEARKAPTFDLNNFLTLLQWQERDYKTPAGATEPAVYIDPDFAGMPDLDTSIDRAANIPDMLSVFSKMSSLITQGFMGGYLSYSRQKFAITGAKVKGPLAAGFPNIWKTVEARGDDEVPGWKLEERTGALRGGGSGRAGPQVIKLSNPRPVGSFG